MNTTDFLSIATAICPDRDAIIFEGSRWTYAQLNERVNRLAGFKRPRSVLFIDALPYNQMGKVVKKELRETYGS